MVETILNNIKSILKNLIEKAGYEAIHTMWIKFCFYICFCMLNKKTHGALSGDIYGRFKKIL